MERDSPLSLDSAVRAGSVHKMGSERGQERANRAKIQGGFTSLQQELGAIDRQLRERTRCARVAGAARHWLSSSASGPLAEAAWEVTGGKGEAAARQLLPHNSLDWILSNAIWPPAVRH